MLVRGRKKKKNINIEDEKEDLTTKIIDEENINEDIEENTPFDDQIKDGVSKVDEIVNSLNNIQIEFSSLLVGSEEERIFYERKVKPLVEEIHFLAIAAQGTSIASLNIQSNAFVKKRQLKFSLNLTYELLRETYCMLEVLKKRNSIYRCIIEEEINRCTNNSIWKKDCNED